jgi:hypothetical protein
MLVCRHVGAAVKDLALDGVVVDGIAADQCRALEQADKLGRTALRQLVMTHPAFVEVDFPAAGGTALRGLAKFVDFKRALIVVLRRRRGLAPRSRLPCLLLRRSHRGKSGQHDCCHDRKNS